MVLDYELAGLGSRGLAAIVDTLILTVVEMALYVTVVATMGPLGAAAALLILLQFLVFWGYFTFFEAFAHGQTPGKKWMGIRVVHDTGHGLTITGAAVRNLLRPVDLLPPPYLLGAILIAVHPRAKRLGDLVAGTVVVRDRPTLEPAATPVAAAPVGQPGTPELADREYALLRGFRERAPALPDATRSRLAAQLAGRFAPRYPARPEDDEAFLEWLFREETARRRGRLGARGPSAAERFVARKEARWQEFHALADTVASEGLDALGAKDLLDFAARYREIAADLARARTYGAHRGALDRLERLAAAGHNALYRRERATGTRLGTFLARDCPAALIVARRYLLVACLVFLVPAAVGYAVLRERPALGIELLPDVLLERAEAGAERVRGGLGYFEAPQGERPVVASGIITNNLGVAFSCFAGGILLGVGSLVLLAYNGLSIGAASGHFANVGLLGYLWTFIAGHGLLELFAIWTAGAAGFLIGRAVLAPGQLTRADALVLNGRLGFRLLVAAGLMLLVAGLIEGFISASGLPLRIRVGASIASALFLVAYLAWGAWMAKSWTDDTPAVRSA